MIGVMSAQSNADWLKRRTEEYRAKAADISEAIEELDDMDKLGYGFTSADPLEEVDIGDGSKPRPTFVNKNLSPDYKAELIKLLREYPDCFAWEYSEMPGLDRELVEHRLPIKEGFRPVKQPNRRFNPDTYDRIKEEVNRLLEAGFIRPCRYAEWISNIVPVKKKNSDKLRVCVDFRDLNKATPKDEYPMPLADVLINNASGHKIFSFLDGNAGYNQIFMAEEDVYKTAFRCPGFIGLYEWVVMTFGLKSAGATYQRAMNLIFHDLLGLLMEVYIDDIVVKSDEDLNHLADLRLALERMRRYGLKMNPFKCAFGVSAGKFLGFIVHENGVEIDPERVKSIRDIEPPRSKKELQKFLGKINFLRRFISNLSGKIQAFTPILKLKNDADFTWGAPQQRAFEEIKRYLSTPPVLRAPTAGIPFRLYLAAEERVIGSVLTQEIDGKEHVITYLSRRLIDAETRYTFIEKLCLCLFCSCSKLRHYLLSSSCVVTCQTDVVKYMLQQPILRGRIGKWAYSLIEYDLAYEALKSVKGQIVADFIVDHNINVHNDDVRVSFACICPWKLYFDGSACSEGQGAGIVLISPQGASFETSVQIEHFCTNNQAEYEALLLGLQILESMDVKHVEAYGDSLLVVQQVSGVCQCFNGVLNAYLDKCLDIIANFDDFCIKHVPRDENSRANDLAQQASGYQVKRCKIWFLDEPEVPVSNTGSSGLERPVLQLSESQQPKPELPVSGSGTSGFTDDSAVSGKDAETRPEDWRTPLVRYLQDPNIPTDRKIRRYALKFTLIDNELYRRTVDGVLLKCLGEDDARVAMGEVHEGICGTHQSAHKMKWLLRRAGFYWPTMIDDCFRYYKGCESCQVHGDVQSAPAAALHPIIKPWPFRGWALDFIGQIHPSSSKGHRFILVATDYFTKWTEAVPLKNMTHQEVIRFITEHIVHRFGIPQTLTTDQGTSFMSSQVRDFAESLRIKLLNSSPYYAQANGQAESSNKTLIKLIKKKIEENPKRWHETLSEALWAHRISKHGATKVTPFELVYGQEAVLPVEINLNALRIARQNNLSAVDYSNLMLDRLDEVTDERMRALAEIERDKMRVAKAYNKKVKAKSFQVGDLVWKTILPIGSRSNKFGKWSPNWEGPYRIEKVVPGNSYFVSDTRGYELPKALNGKYLKKYYPSVWQNA
jgi:ribonuclease HI/transposase InsO family protein